MKRTFKDYLLLAAKGVAMGAADVIPGVSGGTIAFISGIYEELITSIKSINWPVIKLLFTGKFKAAWQAVNGNFLLAVAAGILLSIFSLAGLMVFLLDNYPVQTWSFFFGLILSAIWYVIKQVKKLRWSQLLYFLPGAAFAYFLTDPGLMPVDTPSASWFIFLSGAIAICAMILPGISGSFILVLLGKYSFVMSAVSSFNLPVILVFAAGAIIGLISFSNVLSWLLNRFHDVTIVILGGFMLGSLNKIWPWKQTLTTYIDRHDAVQPLTQQNILPNTFDQTIGDAHLLPAVLCLLAGVAIVFIIEIMAIRLSKANKGI